MITLRELSFAEVTARKLLERSVENKKMLLEHKGSMNPQEHDERMQEITLVMTRCMMLVRRIKSDISSNRLSANRFFIDDELEMLEANIAELEFKPGEEDTPYDYYQRGEPSEHDQRMQAFLDEEQNEDEVEGQSPQDRLAELNEYNDFLIDRIAGIKNKIRELKRYEQNADSDYYDERMQSLVGELMELNEEHMDVVSAKMELAQDMIADLDAHKENRQDGEPELPLDGPDAGEDEYKQDVPGNAP